ncbi:hypothetical protein SCACP_30560 [Sporomusa carbonis]|uniref:BRO-N domain-containing protein n=1 Tax=Sporomusa carbonis TaxID=3076075 RepID=UPI003A6036C5
MQALEKVFEYQGQPVRTIMKDGAVWFIAKDVCECLEIENARDAIQRLDEDEVDSTDIIDSLGRKQTANIVNEPGLYNLVLGSRKPEAKQFKRWVTHDVLPAIRQTGVYAAPGTDVGALVAGQQKLMEMQQETLKILAALTARVETLERNAGSEEDMHVMKEIGREGRRKIFKVEKLGLRHIVDELLRNSMPYEDVAAAVREQTGKSITKSSIARYWKERKPELERMEVQMPSGVKLIEEKRFIS